MSISDKLATIAENEQKVYEAGQKSEYNRFWNSFQNNGERRGYRNAFGAIWTDEMFKPKYPFGNITDAYMMFGGTNIKNIPDLTIKGSSQYCFYNAAAVEHIGVITVHDEMYGICSGCSSLVTIDKLVINYTNTSGKNHSALFNGCSALENIVIEGEFKGGVTFQYSSKLTKDSITSIINALSSTATGKTLTLSKAAVDYAFEELDLAEDGTMNNYMPGSSSTEWLTLAGTKTNWTISLA